MNTHRVPGTDLRVSALCLGAGAFGTSVKGDAVDRLVSAFMEAGGTFFDTAHCYAFWAPGGLGASERELGACLRRLGALDGAVIGTKGGHPDGGEGYPRPDRYLAPEVIDSDVEESLERLQVDRIDLYYLHRDDARVPVDEILDALNAEVCRGRVGQLGASNWSVARLAEANACALQWGWQGFVASQVQWSLAVPNWEPGPDPVMRYVTPEDAAWYAAARMPIVSYSSTAGGFFAGEAGGGPTFDSPANGARRTRACELAGRLGCTPTQVALAYLMHQDPLVIPAFSTANPEHLAEALGSTHVAVSPEEVRWLREG